jgi:hypothetical protein
VSLKIRYSINGLPAQSGCQSFKQKTAPMRLCVQNVHAKAQGRS